MATENEMRDKSTPVGLIIRAVPEVFSKFGWLADLLALIIFAVSALGYFLPLWPWGAIFGIMGLFAGLVGIFVAAVSVIKELNLENSQLSKNNNHLVKQLAERDDLKSLRSEKFHNAIITSTQEWMGVILSDESNHQLSVDDYFGSVKLMVANVLRKELGLDWIAAFEVNNTKNFETKLMFCEPDRDGQNESCLNDIESNAIKYIAQDGFTRNFWTLSLNQYHVLMMRIPINSADLSKGYILTFSAKLFNPDIYNAELTILVGELGKIIDFVNTLILHIKEVSTLRKYAGKVEVHHYSAILYLDNENKPQIENTSVLGKEDILRIQEILADKKFKPLFLKAFDSVKTDEITQTNDAFHLILLPLLLNGQVWRVFMTVVEVPGREMSSNKSSGRGLIDTIGYLYLLSTKDDRTDLFNRFYFYQHIKHIIFTDELDATLSLFVVGPYGSKKTSKVNDDEIVLGQISQVLKNFSNNGRSYTAVARYEGEIFLILTKVSDDASVGITASNIKLLLEKSTDRQMKIGVVLFSCKTKKFSDNLDNEVLEVVKVGLNAYHEAKEKPHVFISDLRKNEDYHNDSQVTLVTLNADNTPIGIQNLQCPFCHNSIESTDSIELCKKCGYVQHSVCWKENGNKCAICGSVETTVNGSRQ